MSEPAKAWQDDVVDAPAVRLRGPNAYNGYSPLSTRMLSDMVGAVDALVTAGVGLLIGTIYDARVSHLTGGMERLEALSLLGAVIFFALGRRAQAYDLNRLRRFTDEGMAMLARWSLAVLVVMIATFLLKIADETSRGWLLSWYAGGAAALMVMRLFWRQVTRHILSKSASVRRRVAVVGARDAALGVCAQLRKADAGVDVIGVYDDVLLEKVTEIGPAGVVGSLDDLIEEARQYRIDDVLITLSWADEARIQDVVRKLRVLPCGLHLCPGLLASGLAAGKLGVVGDTHVLEISRRSMEGWSTIWKIVQDRILAGIGLVLLLPLLVCIAVAIKLDSPGPILFRQRRNGFNRRVFHIYKFRTMTVMEDGTHIAHSLRNDARITRVGAFLRRTCLDELPQLLNVLTGDMSMVGPRPHALAHDDEYSQTIEDYSVRQRVLPGMTGWAQVNGCRGAAETSDKMEKRVAHDLYYVENWSPLFDIKILLMTVRTLFSDPHRVKKPSCLIVVENLPVPFDRRVWSEATTLQQAGYQVSVICPKGVNAQESYEYREGVHIYRHPLPEASGALGYILEYSCALFFEFTLALWIWARRGFDVVHACNPPDTIFLIASFFKLFGKKFIFDHHDINPELYEAKFGRRDHFYRILRALERMTFRVADVSIATNESYRSIALGRGGMATDKVFVVRSGPKLERLKIQPPSPELKKGARHLVGFVGVIGEQEGIDLLLQAAKTMLDRRGADYARFAVVGSGPALESMKKLACEMQVDHIVDFYGRAPDALLLQVLNTADVCVNSDRVNEMNDKSTMNKIMEYMALAKPIVQFEMTEGRFSAGEASLYAKANDPVDFADKIEQLLENPEMCARMGAFGRRRVETELVWEREAPTLLAAYEHVLGGSKGTVRRGVVKPRLLTART